MDPDPRIDKLGRAGGEVCKVRATEQHGSCGFYSPGCDPHLIKYKYLIKSLMMATLYNASVLDKLP